VISMHQAGVENVVASSGTALTVEQIRLIKRFTENITILFDGDAAGIRAAFRGIDMILEEGLNVKVILFPDGEDPDSFSQKKSPEELMSFLNDATDFIHFKCKILLKEAGGDPIKKAELIRDIVTSVAKIPDPIKRTVFTQETSRLMDISEQTLLNELNKIRAKDLSNANKKIRGEEAPSATLPNDLPAEYAHVAKTPAEQIVEENQNDKAFQEQESELMRILLQYGSKEIKVDGVDEEEVTISVADFIVLSMDEDNLSFENPTYQGIFNEYRKQIEDGNIPNEKHFLNSHDTELNAAVINLMDFKYELFDWEKHNIFVKTEEDLLMKAVDTAVHRVKLATVQKNIEALSLKAKIECNDDDILLLMRYHEIKKVLTKVLGRS